MPRRFNRSGGYRSAKSTGMLTAFIRAVAAGASPRTAATAVQAIAGSMGRSRGPSRRRSRRSSFNDGGPGGDPIPGMYNGSGRFRRTRYY